MRGGCGRGGGGACLRGDEGTSGRSTPRHTPVFQTGGQSSRQDEGNGRHRKLSWPRAPARKPPPWFLGRLGRAAGREGGWGGVGCARQQSLPQEGCTLMHMHTHAPESMHTFPTRPLGKGRGAASPPLPQPSRGKKTLKRGLWRPLAKPGQPQSSWPSCPLRPPAPQAVGRGSLARSHNTPLLAPLFANRTWRWKEPHS